MLASIGSGLAAASPSELALSAALAVLFAALGYRMSARHRAIRGVTPWRVPSFAWALLCLFLQFIGLAIEVFAELTTRSPYSAATPTPPPSSTGAPHGRYAPPSGPPSIGLDPPSRAFPVGSGPEEQEVVAMPVDAGPPRSVLAPPPPDHLGGSALFGWYPDPLGRHERRYYDGRRWNEHVANGETVSIDPI